MSMTYHGLAEVVLRNADRPLTTTEIWAQAIEQGLDQKLNSRGSTPGATLAARLYVIARDHPEGLFQTVGSRPKRFYLKDKRYEGVEFEQYESGEVFEEEPHSEKSGFKESDLHRFLAYFANNHFNCYTKTIRHNVSVKTGLGEWVHPDMVGCIFPIPQWHPDTLKLSTAVGNTAVRIISFELKLRLNLRTLREYFFQTVSNSSWAHEGFLVAGEIDTNPEFREELARLSAAFGIGVIRLDTDDPDASEIYLPAAARNNLDWETFDKLVQKNRDFHEFSKRIRNDLASHEIRKEKYDRVYEGDELIAFRTRFK